MVDRARSRGDSGGARDGRDEGASIRVGASRAAPGAPRNHVRPLSPIHVRLSGPRLVQTRRLPGSVRDERAERERGDRRIEGEGRRSLGRVLRGPRGCCPMACSFGHRILRISDVCRIQDGRVGTQKVPIDVISRPAMCRDKAILCHRTLLVTLLVSPKPLGRRLAAQPTRLSQHFSQRSPS
jgi:hypothetical protein